MSGNRISDSKIKNLSATGYKKCSWKQLESQSPVKIDKWLDIDSEECRDKDPDYALTKKWMKIGFEDGFLFTDELGRIWGKGTNTNVCFPYHFNLGKTLYGFRIAKKAAN